MPSWCVDIQNKPCRGVVVVLPPSQAAHWNAEDHEQQLPDPGNAAWSWLGAINVHGALPQGVLPSTRWAQNAKAHWACRSLSQNGHGLAHVSSFQVPFFLYHQQGKELEAILVVGQAVQAVQEVHKVHKEHRDHQRRLAEMDNLSHLLPSFSGVVEEEPRAERTQRNCWDADAVMTLFNLDQGAEQNTWRCRRWGFNSWPRLVSSRWPSWKRWEMLQICWQNRFREAVLDKLVGMMGYIPWWRNCKASCVHKHQPKLLESESCISWGTASLRRWRKKNWRKMCNALWTKRLISRQPFWGGVLRCRPVHDLMHTDHRYLLSCVTMLGGNSDPSFLWPVSVEVVLSRSLTEAVRDSSLVSLSVGAARQV